MTRQKLKKTQIILMATILFLVFTPLVPIGKASTSAKFLQVTLSYVNNQKPPLYFEEAPIVVSDRDCITTAKISQQGRYALRLLTENQKVLHEAYLSERTLKELLTLLVVAPNTKPEFINLKSTTLKICFPYITSAAHITIVDTTANTLVDSIALQRTADNDKTAVQPTESPDIKNGRQSFMLPILIGGLLILSGIILIIYVFFISRRK